jgi:hypothetical protein
MCAALLHCQASKAPAKQSPGDAVSGDRIHETSVCSGRLGRARSRTAPATGTPAPGRGATPPASRRRATSARGEDWAGRDARCSAHSVQRSYPLPLLLGMCALCSTVGLSLPSSDRLGPDRTPTRSLETPCAGRCTRESRTRLWTAAWTRAAPC